MSHAILSVYKVCLTNALPGTRGLSLFLSLARVGAGAATVARTKSGDTERGVLLSRTTLQESGRVQ